MTLARALPDDTGPESVRPAPSRLLGWLPDGTPRHAPFGTLLVEGDRVCCHLCGRWFLSVASHLRAHGWTRTAYVAAFGLELGNPLTGPATHERRSAAFRRRQAGEPAIVRAQADGRDRARSGELAAAAARANRGRAHPQQRRHKTLAALAAVDPQRRRDATRARCLAHVRDVAARAAADAGHSDVAGFLAARFAAGASMAAVSREAGLHKDWVSRHLADLAPELVVGATAADRLDARWVPVVRELGFPGVHAYLAARHVEQRCTVTAIAAEVGFARESVVAALCRHGIEVRPHVRTRSAAQRRDSAIAQRLGTPSIDAWVARGRAAGVPWARLAAESGMPASTLRRRHAHGRP